MNDYYKQLAEGIFGNITERIHRSPLVTEVMHNELADEIDASAAAEVVDSIHLSEIASAMNGNYAMARMALNSLQHKFEGFVAASKYYKLSPEQIGERLEEIFVETVGPILEQMDIK